jgi:hypothetical protein
MPTAEWFQGQVLKALAYVKDNEGLTCESMNGDYVDFWPLYPLRCLHEVGQVQATYNGNILSNEEVASLDVISSADTVVWQLTPAGQARVAGLQ